MSIRQPIQRSFFSWLEEARPRLKRDIRIVRRTDRLVEFAFKDGPDVLRGGLSHHDITIAVEYDGTYWDFLMSHDAYPRKAEGSYICYLCEPEFQKVYSSRDELWRDHLFEPLLYWVNEKLATSTCLNICQHSGSTWARLEQEFRVDPDAVKTIRI